MSAFANIQDLTVLFRSMTPEEQERAEALLDVVSDRLRIKAQEVGKDLDLMILENAALATVAKSVTCDIVGRVLMTSTTQEPVTQFAESALGYSVSGSYLNPGGGVFIKDAELKALGLKRQKKGAVELV